MENKREEMKNDMNKWLLSRELNLKLCKIADAIDILRDLANQVPDPSHSHDAYLTVIDLLESEMLMIRLKISKIFVDSDVGACGTERSMIYESAGFGDILPERPNYGKFEMNVFDVLPETVGNSTKKVLHNAEIEEEIEKKLYLEQFLKG